MTIRRVSFATLLAAAAFVVPGQQASAQDLTVGMPTTPPNIIHMPVILAQDLGLFKKEGITVKTIALDGGVKVYRAMLAGNIDIAMAPGAVMIIGKAKGSPARAFLVSTPRNVASMVVRDNVKTMADLKGKRIGIQQPGGFADINSKAVLRAAKIDPKEVNFVSIATDDVPALVANQVDTAILHVEQEMLAKSKVPSLHAIARMWELQPKALYLTDAATEKTLKDKAKQIEAFTKAKIAAVRTIYTDRAKVIPILVKHTGMPQSIVEQALDFMVKECIWDANTGLGAERFDFTADLMTKVGNIEKGKTPKHEDLIDASFAKKAIASLGEWTGPVCPTKAF
ncbi:MAG: ABC transporter substrate-binding protein [Pseudolabrys sp.]